MQDAQQAVLQSQHMKRIFSKHTLQNFDKMIFVRISKQLLY